MEGHCSITCFLASLLLITVILCFVNPFIIWPVQPRSHNPIENYSERWHVQGQTGWHKPVWKKPSGPDTFTLLCCKILKENRHEKWKSHFSRNWKFLVLSWKKLRKSFNPRFFHTHAAMCACLLHPNLVVILTEFCWAGQENIWLSVTRHGPHCAQSIRHGPELNIFPSSPPTQSVST